jgi:hypothetical protein
MGRGEAEAIPPRRTGDPPMTRATKAQLREEIAELRHVGAQMANVCFNLGQANATIRKLGPECQRAADAMWELRREWDAIKRREPRP